MKPSTFTRAVIVQMCRPENIAETRKTVAEWRATYPDDLDQAAAEFAKTLAEDMQSDNPEPCNDPLMADFLRLAFTRVHWRAVTDYLIDLLSPTSGDEVLAVVPMHIYVPSAN